MNEKLLSLVGFEFNGGNNFGIIIPRNVTNHEILSSNVCAQLGAGLAIKLKALKFFKTCTRKQIF